MEELEKELIAAQNKLSDITIAQNREQLILESKQKNIEELTQKEKDLLNSIKIIEAKKQEEIDSYDTLTRKHTDTISVLSSEIKEKKEVLQTIDEDTKNKKISMDRDIYNYDTKIQDKTKEIHNIDSDIHNLNKVLLDIQHNIKEYNQQVSNLENTLSNLEDKKNIATKWLSDVEENIKEANKILEATNTSNVYINSQIDEKKIVLEEVRWEVAQLKGDISLYKNEKVSLQDEVEILRAEKDKINAIKFSLQKREEANDRREQMIKQKYEEAGVQYS